jgi:hypothetical protein
MLNLNAPKPETDRFPYYFALIVFASGVVLLLWRLTYVTLWSDEFSGTVQLIHLPWKDLLAGNYPWEFNPPLYFLVLKGWITLLGSQSEIAMRMLSVLMWIGSMIAIYFLGKRMGNWRVGVALMAVLAFHPIYQFFSTQLRMYPLLILLSILAFLFYTKYTFEDNHSKAWLFALGITLVLASYTHYFGVLVELGIIVFAVFMWLAKNDRSQYPVFWTVFLSTLFTLPLILLLIRQYDRYVDKASSSALRFTPLNFNSVMAVLSGSVAFDFAVTDVFQVLSLLAVLSGLVILIRNNRKITAFALLAFICLSWLAVFAISTRNINIAPRYIIHVFLISWIILALSLIETEDMFSRLLQIIAIVAIVSTSLMGIYRAAVREYPSPNWKYIAQTLNQEADNNEPIVIMGWDAAPTGYYLNREWLTSYDLEKQLAEGAVNSYLILDSRYSRRLDFINYSDVIYENPKWNVRIIRYVPTVIEKVPDK